MSNLTVAIVGAGIAGLTLAAYLRRYGVDAQVFEQTPELGEVGAGVQLAPNATRLLHRLGLAERLRAVAVAPEAIEMRRWDDNALLRRTPLGAVCEAEFGAPYHTVHRADLHSALLDLLPPGTVRLGRRCTAVRGLGQRAWLEFAGGDHMVADVVVGADGIHSVVRRALVADRPRYSGQTIYRGLVAADRVGHLLDERRVRLWLGPDQHCVCYPISAGRQVSFGATVRADQWRTESWSARGEVADLVAAYDGWHADVRRLLAAADSVSRWALHDRDGLVRWSAGVITVLGDAAHPMLPFRAQGANQAIEDAAVLAGCLAQVDLAQVDRSRAGRSQVDRSRANRSLGHGSQVDRSPVAEALRRYERIRQPRTARVQAQSRGNAEVLHLTDGPAQRRRDADLRGGIEQAEERWLFGYDAELAVAG